ncbi:hypothetical protein K3495_g16194 [Podosphaera aphanis]|nr:hypothetical protein K3495_g16194 [Podosphaera aphanis]
MAGSDYQDTEMTDPSVSQLRQQQRNERTRTEPRGSAHPQGPHIDENWLRQIISEQVQSVVAPILNGLLKDKIQERNNPLSSAEPPENPKIANEIPVSRKRQKFPTWNGDKKYFNCYIKGVEDCIEIDRDLMGTNRAVWYDINLSLPSAAKQKVSVFNASGADRGWNYLFVGMLVVIRWSIGSLRAGNWEYGHMIR